MRLIGESAKEFKTILFAHTCPNQHFLLVSLPELVAQTNMDQQSVNRLREEMTKITNWLSRNAENYFVSEYETPNSEYIDKAKN